jgi:hypothetical protein
MGARNVLSERTWHLVLVVHAIVALSPATDICGFQRFAPTLGLAAWAGFVCVIPIKLVEWQFLTFAMRLWVPAETWYAWPVNTRQVGRARRSCGMLEHGPQARASGSALARTYASLRPMHGWPVLAANTFGRR